MSFATKHPRSGRAALILTDQTFQRLAPGLKGLVGAGREYGRIAVGMDPARIVEQLVEWQPAGVIMEFQENLTELVAGMGFPTVVVMADMLLEGMGCLNVDDHRIGQLAADYLWEKGLRTFGYTGIKSHHAPERQTGFLDALEMRGVSVSVKEFPDTANKETWRKSLEAWLRRLEAPAGVFAAHDPLGLEVLESCRRLDLRVPSDIALLAASDDPLACELVHPGISSVDIPWKQAGLEAGRMLERMLDGQTPGELVVVPPTGIVTRGSTDFYHVADRRIQKAIEYMRRHLVAEINVEMVVRAVGMDRRTLERLFRAQLNRSPKQVLTDMRAEKARELLLGKDLRIGEVAEQSGFGTSEKLAAVFRKRFGKTPREWRKGVFSDG